MDPLTLHPWTIFISAVIAGIAVTGIFQVIKAIKDMSLNKLIAGEEALEQEKLD